MVLTRNFMETVKERAARDPAFTEALLGEAACRSLMANLVLTWRAADAPTICPTGLAID